MSNVNNRPRDLIKNTKILLFQVPSCLLNETYGRGQLIPMAVLYPPNCTAFQNLSDPICQRTQTHLLRFLAFTWQFSHTGHCVILARRQQPSSPEKRRVAWNIFFGPTTVVCQRKRQVEKQLPLPVFSRFVWLQYKSESLIGKYYAHFHSSSLLVYLLSYFTASTPTQPSNNPRLKNCNIY